MGTLKPDVAVVDISMPHTNGLAATKAIRETAPATAVVALTRYDYDAYVQELLNARKLGLAGRTDVVRYALLQGWLRDL